MKKNPPSERDEVDVCIRRFHCGLSDSGGARSVSAHAGPIKFYQPTAYNRSLVKSRKPFQMRPGGKSDGDVKTTRVVRRGVIVTSNKNIVLTLCGQLKRVCRAHNPSEFRHAIAPVHVSVHAGVNLILKMLHCHSTVEKSSNSLFFL